MRKSIVKPGWILVTLTLLSGLAVSGDRPGSNEEVIRVMSWNISDDAFVTRPTDFLSILRRANPDILLLDEVAPAADVEQLRGVLDDLQPGDEADWHISYGVSGGRHRVHFRTTGPWWSSTTGAEPLRALRHSV